MPGPPTLRILPALSALCMAGFLLAPDRPVRAFSKLGENLTVAERDVRVFDNFTDSTANDNQTPDPQFPGWTGAELALWKGAVEWGTGHGDGSGDPTQTQLGDGNANFEPAWMGAATGIGTAINNVASRVSSCGGGVLAFTELNFSDGWRIRFCDEWIWEDGPGNVPGGRYDLQGIMAHEYGHALGLGHSSVPSATMWPSASSGSESERSIDPDDIAGLQCIYGVRRTDKPVVSAVSVDPVNQTVTITGSFFTPTDNEVWFTPAAATSPTSDPRVRVLGANSTQAGTEITVAIPPDAGPGDLHVRIGAVGHYTLSNGFPFDPHPPVPAASTTSFNGSGLNPTCMTSLTPPVVGSTWTVALDATAHPTGAGFTGLFCYRLQDSGTFLPAGELLVDLTSGFLASSILPSSGATDLHVLAIPPDAALLGTTGACQGLTFDATTGTRLCNAELLTLGL